MLNFKKMYRHEKDKLKYRFVSCTYDHIVTSCNDRLAPTNKFTDLVLTSTKASAVLSMAYNQMFGRLFFCK